MAKIKKRRLRWKASPSPQVVGYKLYWSAGSGVDYNSAALKLGNVTEITLPDDVKALAGINGPIELGITAFDEVGNESDLVTLKAPFQFMVPLAPSDLWLDVQHSPQVDMAESVLPAPEVISELPRDAQDVGQAMPAAVPSGILEPGEGQAPEQTRPFLIASNPRRFIIQNGDDL